MTGRLLCGEAKPAYIFLHECWSDVMTAILICVVGLAIVAGVVGLMMWVDRVHGRRVQRRREAWKAAGGVDAYPEVADLLVKGPITFVTAPAPNSGA
jgi:uncharacterized iron-regulated membrane protein